MSDIHAAPVGTAPVGTARPGSDQQPQPTVVRLGSAKGGWFRQVGWRHLIGIVALFFAIFPICSWCRRR